MKRALFCVVLVLAGAPSLSGCKAIKERMARKAAEKALDEGTGGAWTVDKDRVTVRDPDGGAVLQFGAGTKVPDEWPSDVPIYPGAKVLVAAQSGAKGFALTLETKDPPDAVTGFYRARLAGYAPTVDVKTGDTHMLGMTNAATGEQMQVTATLNKPAGTTSVQLFAGKK